MRQVSAVFGGTRNPIEYLLLAIIFFLITVVTALTADNTSTALIPAVVVVVMIVCYVLSGKKFYIGFNSTGTTNMFIGFKPGLIDGKSVDLKKVLKAIDLIREAAIAAGYGGASPSASSGRAITDEPDEAAAEPLPDSPAVPPPDAPPLMPRNNVGDPEAAARTEFQTAAAMYREGRQDEAIQAWKRLIRRYPDTLAGQTAKRNLERLGHG